MIKQQAEELLRKYRSGTCSEEEKALLEQWYQHLDMAVPELEPEELSAMKQHTWEDLVQSQGKVRVFPSWYRSVAAVLALAISSVSAWLFFTKEPAQRVAQQVETPQVHEQDALPGGNRAILSLADGTVISLTEAENGRIAEDQGLAIRKTADGQILYESMSVERSPDKSVVAQKYNQISTPPGGQYRVTLPDGSKVWLNAASSLKYPVTFSESARRVELTGEAYFEVSKLQSQMGTRVPFIVTASNQSVEVLGTRFNINSYQDEGSVRTTLLEGSVRVSVGQAGMRGANAGESLLLKPDQQCVLTGNNLAVRKVNAEDMAAWKDGYFTFERADLKTVMRQLSRWYDLEVVYEGAVPLSTFSGKVDRNMNLSNVLEVLAFAHVKFRIEGKKIMIYS